MSIVQLLTYVKLLHLMGTNVPRSAFVIAIIYAGIPFLNHDAGTQAILNFALTHFRFHLTV